MKWNAIWFAPWIYKYQIRKVEPYKPHEIDSIEWIVQFIGLDLEAFAFFTNSWRLLTQEY